MCNLKESSAIAGNSDVKPPPVTQHNIPKNENLQEREMFDIRALQYVVRQSDVRQWQGHSGRERLASKLLVTNFFGGRKIIAWWGSQVSLKILSKTCVCLFVQIDLCPQYSVWQRCPLPPGDLHFKRYQRCIKVKNISVYQSLWKHVSSLAFPNIAYRSFLEYL